MSAYMAQRPGSSPSPFPSFPAQSPVALESPEPDEEWKAKKRVEIENDFKPIIQDAKDRLEAGMQALTRDSPDYAARRGELIEAYEAECDSIRNLAREEFMVRLADERLLRRVTTGGIVNAEVKQSMVDQQAAILAQIQRNNRRDSTAGGSQPDIASTSSSSPDTRRDSDVRREMPQSSSGPAAQRDSDSRRGAPPPSPSHVPARDPPSSKSPPGKPNHPDPPPTQVRPAPAPPAPPPLATVPEPRYGSPGRNTASPVHERRTTAPSPLQEGWTAASASAPPPASDGAPLGDPRAPTTPITHASSSSYRPVASPAVSSAPTDKRFLDPSSRQASNSPVQERATPQERSIPVPHSPPPAMPSPSRTSGSLNRQTSNTMKEAISTLIPKENTYHTASSPLHAKRSQSNFHGPASNSGTRTAAESWMGSTLTEEPQEVPASTFERTMPVPMPMPMPLGRSRDSAPEKPIASSPPASRLPPQVWTPTPDKDPKFTANGSGSNQRPPQSSPRKPIPAFVPESASPPVDDEIAKNVEREAARRRESEQQWANLEKTKEKEKESLGRASGARLSTASEQISRQSEHVSGGPTSQSDGSSTSARSPDSSSPPSSAYAAASAPHGAASSYSAIPSSYGAASSSYGAASPAYGKVSPPSHPTAPSRTVIPPETIPNPSPFRSANPAQRFMPNGMSASVPPSTFGHSDTETETETETETDTEEESEVEAQRFPRRSPSMYSMSFSSRSSEPTSNAPPPPSSTVEDKFPRRVPSTYSMSFSSTRSSESNAPPPSSNNRYSTHPAAIPIPVPRRSRAVDEDDEEEPTAYSAGEFSRYGIPQSGSFKAASSFSSRVDDAREREWEREREREHQQRVMEAEKAAKDAERAAKKLAEEAERKAEEVRLKEEATQKKEAELRRQEEESERKLKEIDQREADLRRREAEMRKREEDTRLKEAAKQREEAEKQRKEKERVQVEAEKQRLEREQQIEFQKREAEIKERRRQSSMDAESNWGGSTYGSWGTPPRASPASPSPSNTTSSSARSNSTAGSSSTGPTWSSTSKASSAGKSQHSSGSTRPTSTTTPNGKPTWTGASTPSNSSPYTSTAGSQAGARPSPTKPTPKTSASNPPPANPEDWARRQREQAEEQFRKMQEQMDRERRAKEQKAGRMLSKEDVVQIYQQHEQLWSKMSAHSEVTWDMLPWPMYRKPNSAEEITSGAVDAYIMSPHYPDQDKSTKDRVRQQLRRWHEDHFNQKVLSKVNERDKERVKAAAGTVTRNLNNLLERANESKKAGSSVFA